MKKPQAKPQDCPLCPDCGFALQLYLDVRTNTEECLCDHCGWSQEYEDAERGQRAHDDAMAEEGAREFDNRAPEMDEINPDCPF